MPTTRRRPSPLVRKIRDRAITGKGAGTKLRAEDLSISWQQFEYLQLPADTTKSTIAMAFSPDGELVASTHGDHTVKITRFLDGRVLQTLRGHSRTPWTVKFHPKDSRIVASGCLGYEVRVWNTVNGQCLHVATLEAAIISLSFHPLGNIIAIASGPLVYLWDYNNAEHPFAEWVHPHSLRCVRFTPDGEHIIIGAANDNSTQRRNSATNGTGRGDASAAGIPQVTFCLSLWDFRLEAAVNEDRTAFTRPRVLLDHALLYNDGGFDVSHDGLWLCAIAELWKVISEPVAADATSLHSVGSQQREGAASPPSISYAASNPPVEPAMESCDRPCHGHSVRTDGGDKIAGIDGRSSTGPEVVRSSGEGIVRAVPATQSLLSETLPKKSVAAPGSQNARVQQLAVDKGLPKQTGSVADSTRQTCFESGESGEARGDVEQARPAGGEEECENATGGDATEGTANCSRHEAKARASPPVTGSSTSSGIVGATKADCESMAPIATVQGGGKGQSGCCGPGHGGTATLKPWPRHLRLWGSAGTWRGRDREADVGAVGNSRHTAVGTGAGPGAAATAGGSDAPRTPSPRITLKRRLSASWLSGSGGRRSGERRGKSFSRTSFAARRGLSRSSGCRSVDAQDKKPPAEDSLPPLPSSEEAEEQPPMVTGDECTGTNALGAAPEHDRLAPQLFASSIPASESADRDQSNRSPLVDAATNQRQQPTGDGSPSSEAFVQGIQSQENVAGQPEPPPLFFLKVPTAGDRREDVPTPEPTAGGIGAGSSRHGPAGFLKSVLDGPTTVDGTAERAREPEPSSVSQPSRETRKNPQNSGTKDDSGGDVPEGENGVSDGASSRVGGRLPGARGPPGSAATAIPDDAKGRFVPHLVLVSLHADKDDGQQATVVRAAVMNRLNAKQVTSVKLSPSSRYILLGAGSRRRRSFSEGPPSDLSGDGARGAAAPNGHGAGFASEWPHMTTSIYRAIDLQPVNMMPQVDKDVNIAIFHPEPGMGCVYGTKQGMMCIVRMGE